MDVMCKRLISTSRPSFPDVAYFSPCKWKERDENPTDYVAPSVNYDCPHLVATSISVHGDWKVKFLQNQRRKECIAFIKPVKLLL